MDNILDSRLPIPGLQDRSSTSLVFQMRLLTEVLSLYDLIVGGTLNSSSLTHSLLYQKLWKNHGRVKQLGSYSVVVSPYHNATLFLV